MPRFEPLNESQPALSQDEKDARIAELEDLLEKERQNSANLELELENLSTTATAAATQPQPKRRGRPPKK